MSLHKTLEDYGFIDPYDNNNIAESKSNISIGKAVRNASYHNLDKIHLSNCQQILYESYLKNPEGLTDKEAVLETGLPKSSINARRNELVKMNLVQAIGVVYPPDHKGRIGQPNTLWGIPFDGGKI